MKAGTGAAFFVIPIVAFAVGAGPTSLELRSSPRVVFIVGPQNIDGLRVTPEGNEYWAKRNKQESDDIRTFVDRLHRQHGYLTSIQRWGPHGDTLNLERADAVILYMRGESLTADQEREIVRVAERTCGIVRVSWPAGNVSGPATNFDKELFGIQRVDGYGMAGLGHGPAVAIAASPFAIVRAATGSQPLPWNRTGVWLGFFEHIEHLCGGDRNADYTAPGVP